MIDKELFARHTAKAIVAVEQVGGAAVVIENARRAGRRFDPPAAFLAIEAVANDGEDRLSAAFATDPPTGA